MEPFCPLLLASFSLSLARAGKGNDTTPAESNWTSTTAGKDPTLMPAAPAASHTARVPRTAGEEGPVNLPVLPTRKLGVYL